MLRDPCLILLSRQHHNGLALCVKTRRSLGADGSPANVAKLAHKAIERYEADLAIHFEIEEKVVFPHCGDLPVVRELIAEHRWTEELIAQLRARPTRDLLVQCYTLMVSHIRREEAGLFEHIQQILPAETLRRIGRDVARLAGPARF